jgi:hypothetical protein
MNRALFRRIRGFAARDRGARSSGELVPAVERLEDRLVPSGPGTWSTFGAGTTAPRWGAPLVALGPLSTGDTFTTLGTNYFFGGTDGTTTFDDTWAILQGTVLVRPMNPATSPPARHDQAAVAFDNKMYIFGGEDQSGNSLSDVWSFDPVADTWQPQPSLPGPDAWPGGFDAVSVAIGQQIILYGGTVTTGGSSHPADASAYAYNTSDGSWTKLAADPLGSDTGATVGEFQGKMYVFSSTSSTIESFDPTQNTWTPVSVQGAAPSPRAHAAGSSLSSIFWLTGGAGSNGDTWQFNFTTDTWSQKASFPDPGVQSQGAAAFFSFGVPLVMVSGGQITDAVTGLPTPETTHPIGRFQGVGAVASLDNFSAGLPNFVVPDLVVAEPAGSATFAVELAGAGNSDTVTVPLSSTNPSEGTVSPSKLVFTSGDASTPQSITVTGQGDTGPDGDVLFQIQYGPIVSSDPDFSGLTEFVPVIARDLPTFTVGVPGSYDITDHKYPVTQLTGSLPSHLSFSSTTQTISGTADPGTAQTYPLTFQGEEPSTTFSFNLVVAQPSNPVPTLARISPAAVTAGSMDTTITLTGTNFLNTSTVEFNGTPLATTFLSATQLSAIVPTTDLTMAGSAAIAVVNPSPGGGGSGSVSLTISVAESAPAVTSNPQGESASAGQTATFAAAASSTPAPSVQWQVSTDKGATFTDIPGATANTLSVSATPAANGALYRAIFTNSLGTATSLPATLAVKNFAPAIQMQPVSTRVTAGSRVMFTVAVTGDPSATVQWQRAKKGSTKFTNIGGATAPALTLAATSANSGQKFRAVISNSFGTVDSAIATLTVVKAKRKR